MTQRRTLIAAAVLAASFAGTSFAQEKVFKLLTCGPGLRSSSCINSVPSKKRGGETISSGLSQ